MKIQYIYIGILISFLLLSCSKDEDTPVAFLKASTIAFVNQDGSAIATDQCVDPSLGYAVGITAKKEDGTDAKETKIQFVINGVINSIIFEKEGYQWVNLRLKEGLNNVQIMNNEYIATMTIPVQDDFELVN